MNIDDLVAELEAGLKPKLDAAAGLLRTGGNFAEVETVSLRHADRLHAIGIRCRPIWGSGRRDDLSYVAVVTHLSGGLAVILNLGWGGPVSAGKASGYLTMECRSNRYEFTPSSGMDGFVREWTRMFRLFKSVARRGRPSPPWVRWLRGAPSTRVLPAPATTAATSGD